MKETLEAILHEEIKPALGCTGPIVIALAASVARDSVGGDPLSVKVIVDKQTYSGSMTVGIPGTSMVGLDIAAALGAMAGDSRLGLEVLRKVSPSDEKKAESFLKNVKIEPYLRTGKTGLFVNAEVVTDRGKGKAIISKTHNNVVLIEADGKKIFEAEENDVEEPREIDYSEDAIREYCIKDFFDYARNESFEKLKFLKKAVDLNMFLAKTGLEKSTGAGFGWGYDSFDHESAFTRAKARAAAASDARMAGVDAPAMSCSTSGNAGIASSVPVVSIAMDLGKSEEEMLRALALSFLITIYVKSHIGRLSSICSCSLAASMGVTAAVTMLLGGSEAQVENAINSVGGGIGGVVCDGAKRGCAMKIAGAAGIALDAALLATKGIFIPLKDGIVGRSADDTIRNLGRVAQEGMTEVPDTLFDIVVSRGV